jgi:tetratricopeptide (TPR) repeat protein
MLSNILDRISLASLSVVIVLLPLFFLPFTKIPIEASKGLLLVVGLAITIITWAAARFSDGKINIPKSGLLLSGLGLVLVFFLSALFSSASSVSFFGVVFDVGTFWYMTALFLVMLFAAMIIKDVKYARIILLGILLSLGVNLIFQMARFFYPEFLSFGILGGKTENLIGSWNTFGILAGFFGIISLFMMEFFTTSKVFKWILGIMLVFSVILSAAVNFNLIWELIGVFSLLIFVYKISISSGVKREEGNGAYFPAFSFAMVMISLLFFMSGQFIGEFLPDRLGLGNVEIRPSMSATFSVGKSAISQDPVFGIGPNRFAESWASAKPLVINSTQFWNTNFSSGGGTLPTLMINTGILGILAFILFFILFILSGVRVLFSGIKKGANSEATLFFLAALYLFVASWFYSVGSVVLILAFALTGIFVGLSWKGKNEFEIAFLNDPRKSFFFILGLIVLMVFSAGLTFKYVERFASISYFNKALNAQSVEDAENAITKAIRLNSNDLYLRTATEIYVIKINQLASKGNDMTENDKVAIQSAFSFAESAASMAVQYNGFNYLNHQTLGSTYNMAASLGVEGAYEKAILAFEKAAELNPNNPGLKLIIARTYLAIGGHVADAKRYADLALSLKSDYIDALIVLSQIERALGNREASISYAEGALSLLPGNQELQAYVNSLRSGNTAPTPVVSSESQSNPDDNQ